MCMDLIKYTRNLPNSDKGKKKDVIENKTPQLSVIELHKSF